MEISAIKTAVRNEVLRLYPHFMSQNKLAEKLGCAPSTVSDGIIKGKATVSTEKWLEFYSKLKLNTWNILKTPNQVKIENICDDARENHRFMAISDFTGAGKTTALTYYSREKTNSFYVLAISAMSQSDFLDAILEGMVIEMKGSRLKKINAICEKLNSLESPLLIIDDFGKLNDNCYRTLQIIYDKTEFYAGIVIAGTEHLKKYITDKAASKVNGFTELKRRIAYWGKLERPEMEVKLNFLRTFGVDFTKQGKAFKQHLNAIEDYGTLREFITQELKKRANGSNANSVTDNAMTNE
jgi:plasmid maintenance system antidote protein VapI